MSMMSKRERDLTGQIAVLMETYRLRLVPIDPTPAMLEAAALIAIRGRPQEVWAAMLKAAPHQPSKEVRAMMKNKT